VSFLFEMNPLWLSLLPMKDAISGIKNTDKEIIKQSINFVELINVDLNVNILFLMLLRFS